MAERFAKIKNVGKKRKLDVNAICRCCGMQNDEKYPILGGFSEDDGIEFREKVLILAGKTSMHSLKWLKSSVDFVSPHRHKRTEER